MFDLNIQNYSVQEIRDLFGITSPNDNVNGGDPLTIDNNYKALVQSIVQNPNIDFSVKTKTIEFLKIAKQRLIDVVESGIVSPPISGTNVDHFPPPFDTSFSSSSSSSSTFDSMSAQQPILKKLDVPNFGTPAFFKGGSEYYPDIMNPLKKRTINYVVNIDSRFRHYDLESSSDDIITSSSSSSVASDFYFELPEKMNNVVSMQLNSIEMPISYFTISRAQQNYYLLVKLRDKENLEAIHQQWITVPDGSYTPSDLISIINCQLANSADPLFRNLQFTINLAIGNANAPTLLYDNADGTEESPCANDWHASIYNHSVANNQNIFSVDLAATGSGTNQTRFMFVQNYDYEAGSIADAWLDFVERFPGTSVCTSGSSSSGAETGPAIPLQMRLGWMLGFRRPTTSAESQRLNGERRYLLSEGLIDTSGPKYVYLVVDDMNHNVVDSFIANFNQSNMKKNILAKIPMNYPSFWNTNTVSQPFGPGAGSASQRHISEARKYMGPVDIQRLHIQLLNEYGHVLNLNHMDFSFSLTVTVLRESA